MPQKKYHDYPLRVDTPLWIRFMKLCNAKFTSYSSRIKYLMSQDVENFEKEERGKK